MPYVPLKGVTQPVWAQQTLIIPAIGVGNVAQLAIDVLLATWANTTTKIGYFHDESVLPATANDASAVTPAACTGSITLAVEVYHVADRRLVLVQQRAPTAARASRAFAARVVDWFRAAGFGAVLLCCSRAAYARADRQITQTHQFFTTTSSSAATASGSASIARALGWSPLRISQSAAPASQPRSGLGSGVGGGHSISLDAAMDDGSVTGVPNEVATKYKPKAGANAKPKPDEKAAAKPAPAPTASGDVKGMSASETAAASAAAAALESKEHERAIWECGPIAAHIWRFASGKPTAAAAAGATTGATTGATAAPACIDVLGLVVYSTEGENATDGLALCDTIYRFILARQQSTAAAATPASSGGATKVASAPAGGWKTPLSWSYVFGPPPDSAIYL